MIAMIHIRALPMTAARFRRTWLVKPDIDAAAGEAGSRRNSSAATNNTTPAAEVAKNTARQPLATIRCDSATPPIAVPSMPTAVTLLESNAKRVGGNQWLTSHSAATKAND